MDIKKTVIVLLILLAFDFLWFSVSLERIYNPLFSKINNPGFKMRISSGLVAWTLMAILIAYKKRSILENSLIGLTIYGVYNATNHATIEDWETKVAVVDTMWGTFLFASVTYLLEKYFN